jgi:GNAT superfamily N-acetyltransferase
VDPARQGQKLGDKLMAHALARCDSDRLPAYLESSNPRNLSFYQRHGFEILGKIQVGSSPSIVPMLRKPRERRQSLPNPENKV